MQPKACSPKRDHLAYEISNSIYMSEHKRTRNISTDYKNEKMITAEINIQLDKEVKWENIHINILVKSRQHRVL